MLQIVQAPQPVLANPAKKIKNIDKSIHHLIKEMTETLEKATDPEGVGLAAPQVGEGLQLFIIKPTPKSKVAVFINPELTIPDDAIMEDVKEKLANEDEDVKLEGCLSLKDIWGVVERYDKVHLSFLDEEGKKHDKTYDGFFATIIQHEFDHIQGILFPNRVLEQESKLYKSTKNKKGEQVFEEISL
jgi:peptide deformylase